MNNEQEDFIKKAHNMIPDLVGLLLTTDNYKAESDTYDLLEKWTGHDTLYYRVSQTLDTIKEGYKNKEEKGKEDVLKRIEKYSHKFFMHRVEHGLRA